jgi:adenylosuccinate synthase
MFGDEGKGRMVDHFAALAPAIVVRSNGGAQAGHMVVDEDGRGHIFRHHGAGTFAGAPTFLSRFFISNPMLWAHERDQLGSRATELFVDLASPLTTPYDMLINREIESLRGTCGKRHGTCGIGVGETIERLVTGGPALATFVGDIGPGLRDKLRRIRADWVPKRMKAMPGKPSEWFLTSIDRTEPIETFLEHCQQYRKAAKVMREQDLRRWNHVIFEGAQGLCLDEGHMFFPHVTRSRTGLPNVAAICREAGIAEIEAVYVTRCYATRHGEGPFPTFEPSLRFEDPSNAPNEFQGTMRFGWLDLDLLGESVRYDSARAPDLGVNVSAAVTCLDQVPMMVCVKEKDRYRELHRDDIPALVARAMNASKVYTSRSRARARAPVAQCA